MPAILHRTVLFLCVMIMSACQGCGLEGPPIKEARGDSTKQEVLSAEQGQAYATAASSDSRAAGERPWPWVSDPASESCGPGCTQLTFSKWIQEGAWDVWGDRLVFVDGETKALNVVDLSSHRHLSIPDKYDTYPVGTRASSIFSPTISENDIYYSLSIYGSSPKRHELIKVDLKKQTQETIWQRPNNKEHTFLVPRDLDAYGGRLIVSGGAGDFTKRNLSVFELSRPSQGQALIDDEYGGSNAIWGDTVVFWDVRKFPANITSYNFMTRRFTAITADQRMQDAPRIHKHRIVYTDRQHGTEQAWGSFAHSSIVLHDLQSGQKSRVTSGEWIAAFPDVFDDLIVWLDFRNCSDPNAKSDLRHVELWGHDLGSGKSFQITNLPGRRKASPRLWGRKVIFQMDFQSNEGFGLYMVDLNTFEQCK